MCLCWILHTHHIHFIVFLPPCFECKQKFQFHWLGLSIFNSLPEIKQKSKQEWTMRLHRKTFRLLSTTFCGNLHTIATLCKIHVGKKQHETWGFSIVLPFSANSWLFVVIFPLCLYIEIFLFNYSSQEIFGQQPRLYSFLHHKRWYLVRRRDNILKIKLGRFIIFFTQPKLPNPKHSSDVIVLSQ